jgi:5-methylcytosine-specific restriction enzyme A
MYAIITENDVSKWDDRMGFSYHFPSRYLKFLQTGTKIIYYKGRMINKEYAFKRLSPLPHYFGIGTIGKIIPEKNSTNFYAEINDYARFTKAVPFKIDKNTLEEIPPRRIKNYYRDGVRIIDQNTYNRILNLASIEETNKQLNDQKENDLVTVIREGKKTRVYTFKYERKKECRDQALRIHGYSCMVCEFNFKNTYGEWGEGYIHVHHLRPLSSNDEEVEINPELDLAVVCANCHSMIHRKKNVLLSIPQLKGYLTSKLNLKAP